MKSQHTTLPFPLCDPISKRPLTVANGVYTQEGGGGASYRCVDHHEKTILLFDPEVTIEAGAYSKDENTRQMGKAISATGHAFEWCYKVSVIDRIKKFIPDSGVVVDIGCSNCEVSTWLPDTYVKIGADIKLSLLPSFRPPSAVYS